MRLCRSRLLFLALVIDPTKNFDPAGAAAVSEKDRRLFLADLDNLVVGDRRAGKRVPAIALRAAAGGDTWTMEPFNLFTGVTDLGPDGSEPPGYLCRAARLGLKLGASRLGMSVYDLPPGEAICPYHFEWTDEEWLIAIVGRPTLRTPEGERVLDPGDVVCFPAGPDGAHHVRNAGEEPVRVAIVSTKNEFGIAEYPDSDKVGVWAGGTHYMLRRSEHLEYWDGER